MRVVQVRHQGRDGAGEFQVLPQDVHVLERGQDAPRGHVRAPLPPPLAEVIGWLAAAPLRRTRSPKTRLTWPAGWPAPGRLAHCRSCTGNPDLCDYHQVFLPYCSQDLWTGQANTTSPAGSPAPGYYFSGHIIFGAVLDELASHEMGAAPPPPCSRFRPWRAVDLAGGLGWCRVAPALSLLTASLACRFPWVAACGCWAARRAGHQARHERRHHHCAVRRECRWVWRLRKRGLPLRPVPGGESGRRADRWVRVLGMVRTLFHHLVLFLVMRCGVVPGVWRCLPVWPLRVERRLAPPGLFSGPSKKAVGRGPAGDGASCCCACLTRRWPGLCVGSGLLYRPYKGPGHTSSSLADFRQVAMASGA